MKLGWLAMVGLMSCTSTPSSAPPPAEPSPEPPAPISPAPLPPLGPIIEMSETAARFERALTAHRGLQYLGTMEEVRQRGVIRVGMLNNGVSYFIYRGQEVGFQLELASLLAARLDVRLEVVIPPTPDAMLTLLDEGRVDVIPLGQQRAATRPDIITTEPFVFAKHVLVQSTARPKVERPEQLAAEAIHVRPTSRYMSALRVLQAQVPTLRIIPAPNDVETQHLIERVGRGELPFTVSNSLLLEVETTYRDDVMSSLVLAEDQGLVYATSARAPALGARLQAFVKKEYRGPTYNALYAKYFENPKRMGELQEGAIRHSGQLSQYDDLAKKYGEKHGIDWRLLLAQMYQESRFNPQARSWVGAMGLMQLMPATARDLGVEDPDDPEQNIAGGTAYLAKLIERFENSLPMNQRVRFALASYNAGYYHVRDARELARKLGLDPNRWFGHVEKTIVLLEKEQFYRNARFGYCRGSEPAAYVSRIQSKYDGFVAVTRHVAAPVDDERALEAEVLNVSGQ